MHHSATSDLRGTIVVAPGGTGGVGEGVVRQYLAAGAEVVVPTRSEQRGEELRTLLGDGPVGHLHLIVQDYSTFAAAEQLAEHVEGCFGPIGSVVASIGGWWAGKNLVDIGEADWHSAFVLLATAHMAVLRACLPRMAAEGAYSVMVGDSAASPVPSSGLVSMEQAALVMMQRVAAAEVGDTRRVFALQLGQVATRATGAGGITADQVGAVAVAASAGTAASRIVPLHDTADVAEALATLGAS